MMRDAAGADGHERRQKLVQSRDQLVPTGRDDSSAANRCARDDAEVEQDLPEQLFAREKRVQHERREQLHVQLFEHRSADCRLAGADVAAHNSYAFASFDRLQQQSDGFFVRRAWIEESGVRRQRERRLHEAIKLFVLQRSACLRSDGQVAANIADLPLELRVDRVS